jgi:hypothetical protein
MAAHQHQSIDADNEKGLPEDPTPLGENLSEISRARIGQWI